MEIVLPHRHRLHVRSGHTPQRLAAVLPCCRAAVRGPFPDHAGPVWRDVVRVFFYTHARHACHFYDSIGVSIELQPTRLGTMSWGRSTTS